MVKLRFDWILVTNCQTNCTYVIGLDDADVMAMEIQPETVELLERARHATVASDQPVSQQMLVHPGIGEVSAQSLVVQRVVAQY